MRDRPPHGVLSLLLGGMTSFEDFPVQDLHRLISKRQLIEAKRPKDKATKKRRAKNQARKEMNRRKRGVR